MWLHRIWYRKLEYRLNFGFRLRVALVLISWFYIPDLLLNFPGIKWKLPSYGLGRKHSEAIVGVGEGPHEVGVGPAPTDVNFLIDGGSHTPGWPRILMVELHEVEKTQIRGRYMGFAHPLGVSIGRRSSRVTTLAFLLLHSHCPRRRSPLSAWGCREKRETESALLSSWGLSASRMSSLSSS